MKKKNKINLALWVAVLVVLVLGVKYFPQVISFAKMLLDSVQTLVVGAMLAFVLNLIMDPLQKRFKSSSRPWVRKYAVSMALGLSLITVALIILAIITLVVPYLIQAGQVFFKEIPKYTEALKSLLNHIFHNYPQIMDTINNADFNWQEVMVKVNDFISKGFGGLIDSTISLFITICSSFVSLFIIVIFAIYVLMEKQRFIRLYYFFTDMYLSKINTDRLTRVLKTFNQTFKDFVAGECIEAVILTAMCMAGMFILQMPYAIMISILIGVINMIPMVGAFIGGGIGVFLIFTISPAKAVIFLIFLCVIQQIESNIFFPRIIGNKIGLPGIYVMMTIVIGGSLLGVTGMLLGVPFIAAIYKLLKSYFLKEQKARQARSQAALKDQSKPAES